MKNLRNFKENLCLKENSKTKLISRWSTGGLQRELHTNPGGSRWKGRGVLFLALKRLLSHYFFSFDNSSVLVRKNEFLYKSDHNCRILTKSRLILLFIELN